MFIDLRGRVLFVALLTFLFTLTFTPSQFAQKGQSKEMPITASKEALTLFLEGRTKADNLEDPGTLFDQAREKDPNFAFAYLFGARNNREFRANLAKAVELADKASPGEREWILAAVAQSNGDLVGRKAHLDQLMKLHPGDKRVHEIMGLYHRSIGDEQTAMRHFADAIKMDAKYAPAYNDIGYSYLNLGKYAEAESAFKNYIRLIPKNPNPYDSYAELLMKMGKYDQSIVQYNKAIEIDPKFVSAHRGVGNNYDYKGEHAKARESYQRMADGARTAFQRDQAMLSIVNSYVAEGHVDKALEANEMRRATAEKAGDIQMLIGIHVTAGFILIESGRLDDATKQLAKADQLRDDPSLPVQLAPNRRFGKMMANARLLIAREDFAAARSQLNDVKQHLTTLKNPNFERAYNGGVGLLELKQKNYPAALEAFSKADPNDASVLYYMAEAYEGAGNTKQASRLYGKVADWNDLDTTGHALVRTRAAVKGAAMAKLPK